MVFAIPKARLELARWPSPSFLVVPQLCVRASVFFSILSVSKVVSKYDNLCQLKN